MCVFIAWVLTKVSDDTLNVDLMGVGEGWFETQNDLLGTAGAVNENETGGVLLGGRLLGERLPGGQRLG